MNLRLIIRTLAREPGFSAIAVLTLALGIGANTAIFSLINGILLQALPYPAPARLFTIETIIPKLENQFGPLPVNGRHLLEWRKRCSAIENIAAIDSRRMTLTGSGDPEQLSDANISAELFPLLGIQPALGRNFLPEEDRLGHQHVTILTDALWRKRFSADPQIIGRSILLDGAPHVVVGILPRTLHFFANHELAAMSSLDPRTDLFRPIALDGSQIGLEGDLNYMAIVRLKPGFTPEQAAAQMDSTLAALEAQLSAGERSSMRVRLTPLQEQITGQSRKGLLVLMAAVGAVLLIVCVNLANLMLARAAARRRDAAIRAALGASAADLVRHALTESLVLALVGGVLGVLGAYAGISVLVRSAPVDLPRLDTVHLSASVLAFSLALALLTSLVFGLLPALRASRAEPSDALRSGGRAATDSARGLRVRSFLVGSEVALSALLLIVAGLLLHSFVRLLRVDRGFNAAGVIAADLTLPPTSYAEAPSRIAFYNRVLGALRTLPGVRSAGLVSVLPLEGEGWSDAVSAENDTRDMVDRPLANYRFVSPGYFTTMGIPLLEGRFIEDRDRDALPAMVSAAIAKSAFHGDALGRRFRRGDPSEKPFTVVGVAGDTPVVSLQKTSGPLVYVPFWYRSRMKFSVVVKTTVDPRLVELSLRTTIHSIDANVPVGAIRTMEQVIDHSVAPRQFQLALVLLFAVAALLLASLGIYGVISYVVTQRRTEIGIRMALGAQPATIYRMVVAQGLAPVAAGLAAGTIAALTAGRLLSSMLFQVSERDPLTYLAVSVALLIVAFAACIGPGRRAVSADPASVLRQE